MNLIIILGSNGGIYSSSEQGLVLKATASTYAHASPAGRVGQQAGSSRVPDRSRRTFNGKSVSSHRSHGGTASAPDDGKRFEDAYWERKPLQGRQITSAGVLKAYGYDKSSLRSGFFLQKLCLQNILHGHGKVSPDQVIHEFNRLPDRRNKYKLAIARFNAECCLRGLALNGRKVPPEVVVKGFQAIRTPLELGRFKAECCLRNLPLSGHKVTPDAVVKDYQAAGATLELARFREQCCLKGLVLNGQKVTPDAVVKDFQAAGATLELVRFKEHCCLTGLVLNGQKVTPDTVAKGYQSARASLELARFKEQCCLRSLVLNGQLVTPDEVVRDYQAARAPLELARFKAECCLRRLELNGRQVIPDAVVKDFPGSPEGKLGTARFKEHCCLKGLMLKGQKVTPDEVVKEIPDSPEGKLGMAHFKAECCLKGLVLNGQQISPDEVVKAFPDNPEGRLGRARFKEHCCLRGLVLNGQPISPDEVVKEFPDNPEGKLGIARFKEHCCLRGLVLDGKQVTPDAVVMDFPDSPEGKLGIVRFKEHCCLRNLSLNDKQVTPDVVVKGFQAVRARLELARFKEQCFLRGLPLTGKPVKSGEVVKDFPDTPEGKLGIARFIEQCCLKGLLLNGQQVTPDVVVKEYQAVRATLELGRFKEQCCLRGLLVHGQLVTPGEVVRDLPDSPEGKLGKARFKEECCMRNLPLNGEQVTPDSVIKDFPDSPEGKLGMARFKERCCLRGLPVSGQPVTPDEVVKNFQAIKATLELVRFKAECCLRGLAVHGQVVTPEAVVKDYECGGWLFESTIFHSQLALNARELNGNYLDNQKVLDAFNKVPGDHSARKTRHLIQRLKQSRQYDETNEAQDILQEAWQILNNVSVKDDEQHRLQCILTFMAMQHELTIDHQSVSAEQVLQSIKRLRCSFQNSRLYFFFLANCYITGRPVNGRQIHKDQVWKCLQRFPEGSHLHHALGCWFEQCSSEAYIMDELLIKREDSAACSPRGSDSPLGYAVSSCQQEVSVAASAAETRKQWLKTEEPGSVENQVSRLNALTLKTLEIIQEINDSYGSPRILITGSYARFLQNLCSLFNDIDIICTTEASARILFQKLQALNTNKESEIPKRIIIWPIPGCQAIKLPKAYNIQLKDGDLGRIAMRFQVNIDARVAHGNAARLAIHVPGIERLVWCLSFAEETRLLNDTLEHLAENLDPLTEQLKKGEELYIPRTILFNFPQSLEERIYGLLMRSLLTLNKARKLIALKPDHLKNPLQEERQHLHALTANLQTKLTNHACRNDFGHIVNSWLSTTRPVNDYEIRRKEFITTLLAMMHSE